MKFFHLRVRKDGVYHKAADKKAQFRPQGGMTIGYVKVPGNEQKMLVTFARCSERDVWNRQRSIQICLGRFAKGKYSEIDKPENKDKYEVLLTAALSHEKDLEKARTKLGIKARAA